jgi:RNA polymerase sigma factor (sigma-70 family)
LTIVPAEAGTPEIDLLWLHEALDRLAELDTRKSQIVELKFFGGLTTEEIAATVGISRATVEREWTFSRAWLYRAVSGTD